jgi:hypothetical protein
MLARQRELSAQTKALDGTRGNLLTTNGQLPAAMVEKLAQLATGEGELESEASDALKLLEEDGTTAVFPPMVEQLRDDLGAVAKRLQTQESGVPTQTAQREVEDLLALLINALRKTIELKAGGHCTGQCNGQPPLVPVSAELKMLKYLQERVNKTTKEVDGKPADERAKPATATESLAVSKKQGRVQDLTRRLAEKLGKENDTEGGR